MKQFYNVVAALFLIGMLLPGTQVFGQETEEKKKQEMEEKKKEAEKKLQEEIMIKELEQAKQLQEQEMKRAIERYRVQRRASTGIGEAYAVPDVPPAPNVFVTGVPFRSDNSFSLSFHKTFDGESISKKSSFTVDEDVRKLRFSVSGACKEGEISVKIMLPGDKTFNQVQIDSSADINWSQVLTLDDESKEYFGEWTLEIKSSNARGTYSLSITTY